MTEKPTVHSIESAVGYFILLNAWIYLLPNTELDKDARALLERLKAQLARESDPVAFSAIRAFSDWRVIDMDLWRVDIRYELGECATRAIGQEQVLDNAEARLAIGNTLTCEDCDMPQNLCTCEGPL